MCHVAECKLEIEKKKKKYSYRKIEPYFAYLNLCLRFLLAKQLFLCYHYYFKKEEEGNELTTTKYCPGS